MRVTSFADRSLSWCLVVTFTHHASAIALSGGGGGGAFTVKKIYLNWVSSVAIYCHPMALHDLPSDFCHLKVLFTI